MRTQANDVTEAIAAKDRNNLYVASSFFRDSAKYKAFCTYYAIMRLVDDRVDNLPVPYGLSETVRERELGVVTAWEQAVDCGCRGMYPNASLLASCDFAEAATVCESFIDSYRLFPVSSELWANFFAAMRSDLLDGEFVRWTDFLAYAEGATVAPTTIYLWLIMSRRDVTSGAYELPHGLDLFACGRHLGIFAYLGHIIRDLASDVTSTTTRLCIAREDMSAHGVDPEMLRNEAKNHQASQATKCMVADLLQRARGYLARGRALAEPAYGYIESDSRFILELIIAIYEQIIGKIESSGCDPMASQHHLTELEKYEIVQQVAGRTGFRIC